jgi:hypothetical protein
MTYALRELVVLQHRHVFVHGSKQVRALVEPRLHYQISWTSTQHARKHRLADPGRTGRIETSRMDQSDKCLN